MISTSQIPQNFGNNRNNNNSPPEEIRISLKKSRISSYLLYAATQLIKEKRPYVIIKATGNAISRACIVAEVLKHRINGLHQINKLSSIQVTDQGNVQRFLTLLDIKLTLNPNEEEKKEVGYQGVLPNTEVTEWAEGELDNLLERIRGPFRQGQRGGFRGRGRGRSTFQNNFVGGVRDGTSGEFRVARGYRGGFTGNRGGFAGNRGGFAGNRGGFAGNRGGFAGNRNDFYGNRGGFSGNRGGFFGNRDNFTENRGDFYGNRDVPRGDREDKGERDRF